MPPPSKNSRVARKDATPVQEDKSKWPFWLSPYKPGKVVKPCGHYRTEGDAIEAQKQFNFETRVGSWGNRT